MTTQADTIETARLRLVPLRVPDAGELAAVLDDTRLYEWIGGYGTEATRALTGWLLGRGAQTLVAYIHPGNVASEIVARHSGFIVTGEVLDGERKWRLNRGV